ncbi:MAG: hypothetical protein PHY42_07185 [Bacilli bacterium]|nr:hypothetical protein [Bacilli bacterium]
MEEVLPHVFLWQVRAMSLSKRIAAIQEYECFLLLKKQSKRVGISASDAEIVSWLDNIIIMKRLLENVKTSILVDCAIAFEEILPTRMRIDVLLYRGSHMMLIESCYEVKPSEATSEENLSQLEEYKKMLQFQHGGYLILESYLINFLPEYDASGKILNGTAQNTNDDRLSSLAKQIEAFFS